MNSQSLKIRWRNFTDLSNELLIGWINNHSMVIWIRDIYIGLSLTGGYEMANLATGWHKNSFTLKTGSQIKVGRLCLTPHVGFCRAQFTLTHTQRLARLH